MAIVLVILRKDIGTIAIRANDLLVVRLGDHLIFNHENVLISDVEQGEEFCLLILP